MKIRKIVVALICVLMLAGCSAQEIVGLDINPDDYVLADRADFAANVDFDFESMPHKQFWIYGKVAEISEKQDNGGTYAILDGHDGRWELIISDGLTPGLEVEKGQYYKCYCYGGRPAYEWSAYEVDLEPGEKTMYELYSELFGESVVSRWQEEPPSFVVQAVQPISLFDFIKLKLGLKAP